MKLEIPRPLLEIMEKLASAGYETVAVGGCVRDCLLGKQPHDWDMATAATPEEMKQVLSGYRLLETGLRHGTLTVLHGGEQVELTAFRRETGYADGRHPDSVEYTRSLRADLARRDFTINAMAWSSKTGLVDCFGGQEDLKTGSSAVSETLSGVFPRTPCGLPGLCGSRRCWGFP